MRQLRTAFGFLTPLPFGTPVPDAATAAWFPVVGAVLGLAVGGVWWAAGEAFDPVVAAALAVAVDAALTGALHLDGLADSADGLLAHGGDPARRLGIMRAPDVGAFGVVAVVVVLLLRWSAFVAVEPDVVLVAATWSASRAAMAIALVRVRYVGGGLGSAFLGGRTGLPVAVGVVLPVVLALGADAPAIAVVALAAGTVAAVAVVALARQRVGGVTGDVLGAAGVVAETVALLVAAARW